MKILTINCGSSSIKYKLYRFPQGELVAKGLIEHVGEENSSVENHAQGMQMVFSQLMEQKVIKDVHEIKAVGHRVVHGGETFQQPHLVDQEVIKKIRECIKLAPLHNPANLAGIKACRKILRKVKHVAVFDTAFHQTLLPHSYMYAIPMKYYKRYKIRKYGFHGTSHQYVASRAAKILQKPLNKLKLITCHLGNGCSVAAIDKGSSVDTSMGFTPLEGLMMGTRCGDIDTAAVLYLMRKEFLSSNGADKLLNKMSGLLGVSGISNDVRDIKAEIKKGNENCKLAMDMFVYRIKKYIGSYLMALGGADAVCLTAGIGENCKDIVDDIEKSVKKVVGKKTKVLVVPTNEELMIATLTYDIVKAKIKTKSKDGKK